MRRTVFRFAVSASVLLACLILVECVVRVADLFPAERASFDTEVPGSYATTTEAPKPSRSLLHPYLGWSTRPGPVPPAFFQMRDYFEDSEPTEWALANLDINVFGNSSQFVDYRDLGAAETVIGVAGGSVAAQLCLFAGDTLAEGIANGLGIEPETVAIVNLGSGAYKQPQQAIALLELVALGVEFDAVINLDGVNELVFGGRDAVRGRHPIYPSSGHFRHQVGLATHALSVDQILLSARVLTERAHAQRLVARIREGWIAHHSELAKSLLGTIVRHHLTQATALETELQEIDESATGNSAMVALDDLCLGSELGCLDLIADIWVHGSRIMDQVCAGYGIAYLHALQPNQYDPGSKPLTDRERDSAITPGSIYDRIIPEGYRILRQRSDDLIDLGISFADLSLLFSDIDRTLYVDDCCHVNHLGSTILAEELATEILAVMIGPPTASAEYGAPTD